MKYVSLNIYVDKKLQEHGRTHKFFIDAGILIFHHFDPCRVTEIGQVTKIIITE